MSVGPSSDVGRPRTVTMSSIKTNGPPDPPRGSGEHTRGRGNAADQNPPINTLYVGNLPTTIPSPQYAKFLEDNLNQLFSGCKGFSKLSFRQKNNGPMCFVEFEDVPSATKALNELYGNTLNGIVKAGIRLSFSKNPLGVRTTAPNGAPSNKFTSPIQSPTTHAPIQFGNLTPGVQDAGPGLGRPIMPIPIAHPAEAPRSRLRADTMELMMGPSSPPGRFMPASPPTGGSNAFGAVGNHIAGFNRAPMNIGIPTGGQPFVMASSPPSTSPANISTYQPAAFQPFVQFDMNRDMGHQGYDPTPGS